MLPKRPYPHDDGDVSITSTSVGNDGIMLCAGALTVSFPSTASVRDNLRFGPCLPHLYRHDPHTVTETRWQLSGPSHLAIATDTNRYDIYPVPNRRRAVFLNVIF